MKKASKSYKITNIINEYFNNKPFTIKDVLILSSKMYKGLKFSPYSINQYCIYYVGWGFLSSKNGNNENIYELISQIPTDMSTYMIKQFAFSPKEIQNQKLEPFILKIRQLKIENLKKLTNEKNKIF